VKFYDDVIFEYEDRIQGFCSPWAGHKYFAYDLIRNVQPEVIVELGTYKGMSFYSFCQAVKDARYDASLYAVDTWHGDEHGGFYEDDVFKIVNEIKEDFYSSLKIKLLRKRFDDAVGEFENDSIDLLHIDGLHTYEAVKHDFETWFTKVKKTGIILLHDICVVRDGFGVSKFWEELNNEYKTIEFHQSCGLGILFKDSDHYKTYIDTERELQVRYTRIAEDNKNEEMSKFLAERDGQIAGLSEQIASLGEQITSLNEQITSLNQTMHETINSIYQSTSWRLTRPLRFLSKLVNPNKRMLP
jgi:hypothetical protein